MANVKTGRIIARLPKIMKEGGQLYRGDGSGHRKAAGACGEPITDALDHCVG